MKLSLLETTLQLFYGILSFYGKKWNTFEFIYCMVLFNLFLIDDYSRILFPWIFFFFFKFD